MENLNLKEKKPQKEGGDKKGGMPQMPEGGNFWMSLGGSILTILLIATLYSYVVDYKADKPEQVGISQLATDITEGKITSVVVSGDDVKAIYNDEQKTEKTAKKEGGTALSDTLSNYGVTSEQLKKVAIEIKKESGFFFWCSLFGISPAK